MAILTSTSTYASFGSELVDQDNYFSLSNPTYLTIPATGWYVVSAYAVYGAITAGGYRYTYIEVNSPSTIIAEDIRSSSPSGVATEVNLSGIHYFSAGDVVKLRAHQSSGSTITLDARMAIVKVG